MEPDAAPGNTTFIAGFTQCRLQCSCYLRPTTNPHELQPTSGIRVQIRQWHGMSQCLASDNSFSLGAFCESPGEEWDGQACDSVHSTCGGTVQDCHGRYARHHFCGCNSSFLSVVPVSGFRTLRATES